jgi:predicted lipid-binding transport protein (Tim44 family)
MGESFQFFDIILFAMVAAFLVLRLRSVLGRRTGNEQRRDPFARPPAPPAPAPGPASDNVVSLPDRGKSAAPEVEPGPLPLATGLKQIHAADQSFDENGFLHGARGAFEMIVGAFAAGDTATLRPLLSDDVYDSFNEAIRARTAQHETHETRLVAIDTVDLVEAGLDGRTAVVTVKFISQQINVTRAADGSIVDGDPERVVEKTDFWTFARNTRSSDPNWQLVATRSA